MANIFVLAPAWVYLTAFGAALFLVNGVPHFVHGVSGKTFPTPFSGGAGTLDGPARNVLWGGANLVFGAVLLRLIGVWLSDPAVQAELVVVGLSVGVGLGTIFRRGFGDPKPPPEGATSSDL